MEKLIRKSIQKAGGNAERASLADVLLALGTESKLKINNLGGFSILEETIKGRQWVDIALPRWNLRNDNLTEQSEECLAFLSELLPVDK